MSGSPVNSTASVISGKMKALPPVQKVGVLAAVAVGAMALAFLPGHHDRTAKKEDPRTETGGDIGRPFVPIMARAAVLPPPGPSATAPGTPGPAALGLPAVVVGAGKPVPIKVAPIMAYAAPAQQGTGLGSSGTDAPATRIAAEAPDPYAAPDMGETKVSELRNPDFLIEQGRQIPCIGQTRLNTTFGGPITALIPRDVRGSTGRIVLLDKGAMAFGTIEKGIINGLDRAFVLWRQITTATIYDAKGDPHKYRVRTDSPAADELGQTGLDGDVDRHIIPRFGGVIALSLLQGGIQAANNLTQRNGSNSTGSPTINLNSFTGNSDQLATTLLQSTINIPDVLNRRQGEACTIFLARDLDMTAAYRLTRNR